MYKFDIVGGIDEGRGHFAELENREFLCSSSRRRMSHSILMNELAEHKTCINRRSRCPDGGAGRKRKGKFETH